MELLDRAMDEHRARARTEPAVPRQSRTGGGDVMQAPFYDTSGGGGVASLFGIITQAAEQYRHNTGWPANCFPAGSLVTVADGVESIEDLAVGDSVIDHNGELRCVTETMTRAYRGEVVVISASGILPIRATTEHPFYVDRGGEKKWVAAGDLDIADRLLMPIERRIVDTKDVTVSVVNSRLSGSDPRREYSRTLPIDADSLRLIGIFLAEGNVIRGKRSNRKGYEDPNRWHPEGVSLGFHVDEVELHDFVTEQMARLFGTDKPYRHSPSDNGIALRFNSRVAGEFFSSFGHGARNKFIPAWIRALPLEKTDAIVRGFWDGDGSYAKRSYKLFSSSMGMLVSLRAMLLRRGVFAGLSIARHAGSVKQVCGSPCVSNDLFQLSISGKHFVECQKLFGIYEPKALSTNGGTSKVKVDAEYAYLPMRSIAREKIGYDLLVYNLEVDSSHTYQVGGVAVHNCIRAIAQRIAAQPVHVAALRVTPNKSRQDVARVKSLTPQHLKGIAHNLAILPTHSFVEAVNNPNPMMPRWSFMYVTVASFLITGKSFWWMYQTPNGEMQLWPLPTHWVTPKPGNNRVYDTWVIQPYGLGTRIEVPAEDICFFSMPDPGNPLGSISALQTAARAITINELSGDAMKHGLMNGVNPGHAITIGRIPGTEAVNLGGASTQRATLTDKQRSEIIAAIKARYRGVQRMDEPIILDGFIEDIKTITRSNREMQFQTLEAISKAQITQGFGVNPVVMGEIEHINKASSAAAESHMACFPAGTRVLTSAGAKRIEDVLTGSKVWTHLGRWRAVERCMRREFDGDLVTIHAKTPNWTMRATPEHPVLIRKPSGEIGWVGAGDISRGDYFCLPRNAGGDEGTASIVVSEHARVAEMASAGGRVQRPVARWARYGLPDVIQITDTVAWCMGLFLAEGHTGENQVVWSIHEDEDEEFGPKIEALAVELGLGKCGRHFMKTSRCVQRYLNSGLLVDLFTAMFGRLCGNKRVPSAVFEWPECAKKQFVAGYLMGDGSFLARAISYSSVSESIAIGMRTLLATLGIPCGVSFYQGKGEKQIRGRTVLKSDYFLGRINAASPEVAAWCGITIADRVKSTTGKVSYLVTDDAVWFPIEAVERKAYRGFVYNIEVEEDASYCTDVGAVHNCNTINPLIMLLSDFMTIRALPRFDQTKNLRAFIEESSAIDPDQVSAKIESGFKAGVVTKNEYRHEVLQLPPVKGGDAFYIPAGVTILPAEMMAVVDGDNVALADNADDGSPSAEDMSAVNDQKPVAESGKPVAEGGKSLKALRDVYASRRYNCIAKGLSRDSVKKVLKARQETAVKQLRRAVFTFLEEQGKAIARDARSVINEHGLKRGAARIADEAMPSKASFTEGLKHALKPALTNLVTSGAAFEWQLYKPRSAKQMMDLSSKDAVSDLRLSLPSEVRKAIGDYVEEMLDQGYWGDVDDAIRDRIAKAITDGIESGESNEEVSNAIGELLGGDADSRADLIAQTEGTGALNSGNQAVQDMLSAKGLISGKEWLAIDDKLTRDEHAECDGQVVDVDQPFDLTAGAEDLRGGETAGADGYTGMYPGAVTFEPSQRCRCRCSSGSVIPDDDNVSDEAAAFIDACIKGEV